MSGCSSIATCNRVDGRTYAAADRRRRDETSTHGGMADCHLKLHLDLHQLDGRDLQRLRCCVPGDRYCYGSALRAMYDGLNELPKPNGPELGRSARQPEMGSTSEPFAGISKDLAGSGIRRCTSAWVHDASACLGFVETAAQSKRDPAFDMYTRRRDLRYPRSVSWPHSMCIWIFQSAGRLSNPRKEPLR